MCKADPEKQQQYDDLGTHLRRQIECQVPFWVAEMLKRNQIV